MIIRKSKMQIKSAESKPFQTSDHFWILHIHCIHIKLNTVLVAMQASLKSSSLHELLTSAYDMQSGIYFAPLLIYVFPLQ